MSIAHAWHALDRKLKLGFVSDTNGRSAAGGLLGRMLVISLCLYLIPALLAVLAVGGLGIVLLTIVSAFGGSPPGARSRSGERPALPNRFKSSWNLRAPHPAPFAREIAKRSRDQRGKAG